MREFNARSKTHGSQISLARHQNRKLKNQNKNTVKRDKNHYATVCCSVVCEVGYRQSRQWVHTTQYTGR